MNDAVLKNLNEALMLAQFRGADLGNRREGGKSMRYYSSTLS